MAYELNNFMNTLSIYEKHVNLHETKTLIGLPFRFSGGDTTSAGTG